MLITRILSHFKNHQRISLYPVLLVALICGSAICAGTPNQDDRLTLTLRVANRIDAPLEIIGLKRAEEAGKEPLVHFRNNSSLKTARIWLEAIVRDPREVMARTNSNSPNLRWPAERVIEPGSDSWAHESELSSHYILIALNEHPRSRCIIATAWVMNVEFADGSSWWYQDKAQPATFPDGISQGDLCNNSQSTGTEIHELAGPALRHTRDPEKYINWEKQNSYSISCPVIRLHDEKYYAACPF